MPSTYSQNLRIELIANGEQSGTWGNTTNVNFNSLDSAIAGYVNVPVTSLGASFALTANNGSPDQSRNMVVNLSGTASANFTVYIPPASKFYVIRNATSYDATISNSTAPNGTTGTGGSTVTIKANTTSQIFSDGTNVREALTGFAGNLTINGDLAVNGNTTLGNARLSGSYTGAVVSTTTTITVTTATAHGYTSGDTVQFIPYSGSGVSGSYTITVTGTTSFTFTYTGSTAVTSGNCFVTNDTITLNGVVQPGVVIEGSSSTIPALRITAQSGTAAALLIDDQSNPDSTPFLIDSSGNVVTGHTAALTTFNNSGTTPRIQEIGITANDATTGIALFNATPSASGVIDIAKSAGATVGTYTAVASDEALGLLRFSGSDGTDFAPAASIGGFADDAVGAGDMPGRLVFSTVPNGSATLTERMRINNAGNVIIGIGEGTASATGGTLRAPNEVGTNLTGVDFTIAAGNGTGTGGSGSILFQTAPVGTSGSTANTLATVMAIANTGNVGIGSTSLANTSLRISKNITGSSSSYGVFQDGQIQSTVTSATYNYVTASSASGGTLSAINYYQAVQGTLSTVPTNQYGFIAGSTLIGATNNYGFYAENTAAVTTGKTAYGFYSAVNTASGGGTAWGIVAAGTASNQFASNLLLGPTTATLVNGQVTATNRLAAVADNDEVSIVIRGSSTTAAAGYAVLALQKTQSTAAATLTTTTSGSNLGVITFDGVNDAATKAIAQGAAIATFQDANVSPSYLNNVPAGLRFYTTNTVNGVGERLRINSTGTVTVGTTAQNGAALTTTAPAKLYIDAGTYTDSATGATGTVTHGTIASINNPAIAATNVSVTYTNASTLYIDGAPSAGTNVTITNPYSLYVNSGNLYFGSGNAYFGGDLTSGSTLTVTFDSATTGSVITPFAISATSTGTPVDGIGTGLNFITETLSASPVTGAAIRSISTEVDAGSEDFDLSFLTMAAGAAAAERFRAKSTGEFQFNSGYGSVATVYGTRAWANFDPTVYTTVTGTYTWSGTTATINFNSHGFLAGDIVYLNFTSGAANANAYRLFYTVVTAATNSFTVSGASLTQAVAANVSWYLCTPNASGNIRRISVGFHNYSLPSYNGPPDYAIMFTNAMPDNDYAWSGSAARYSNTSGTAGTVGGIFLSGPHNLNTNTLIPIASWKKTTALWVTSYYQYNYPTYDYPAKEVNVLITR